MVSKEKINHLNSESLEASRNQSSQVESDRVRMDCATTQYSTESCRDEKTAVIGSSSLVAAASIAAELESEPGGATESVQSQAIGEPRRIGNTTIHHSNMICCDQEMADLKNMPPKNSTEKTVCTILESGNSADNIPSNGCGVLSQSLSHIAVPSSKKRKRDSDFQNALRIEERNIYIQPSKKSRFSVDDYANFRRMCSYGPISIDWDSPSGHQTRMIPVLRSEMFDDAEGDETFDIKDFKKSHRTNSSTPAGLLSAILGSPSKPCATAKPEIVRSNPFPKSEKSSNDQSEKRAVNKKAKKKSTEKEKMAAIAILEGEVDLLRILPREDCNLLGKRCFIFTLKQLEWVLNEDKTARDVCSRRTARELLTQTLEENNAMVHESKKSASNFVQCEKSGEDDDDETQVSSSIKDGGVATEPNLEESNKDFLAARKFDIWRKCIETWRKGSSQICETDQFPLLDGPLSCFFPAGTLQFMESIDVKLVFDFLCLKRTESGLVVEMFRAWRKKCGLRDINLLPLSKHLTGIGTRIEEGLKGNLVAGNDSSKWLTGAMVVLSGAAKEFLVDHSKIFSGTQFIETRTKNLADQFSEWRARKGLTALKGSGKVAMVSAWKTQVKEELELESSTGKVILIRQETETETEMMMLDNNIGRPKQQNNQKKVEKSVSKTKYQSSVACEALDSAEFFADFFSDEQNLKMFQSVGITTAQQFIDARKGKNSDLLKALLRMKSEQWNGKNIQVPSSISLLYHWNSRIKKRLENLENGKNKDDCKIKDLNPKLKKPKTLPKESPRVRKSGSTNPFDALSASSKEFLTISMNICTAEDFLATRTTDIANEFIKWRKDKGMTALKGLGAVASISGWKKLVRIKAASLGESGIAEMNLSRNTKIGIGVSGGKSNDATSNGAPDLTPENAQGAFPPELNLQNVFSVLSHKKNEVFHFHLESRNLQSSERKTYLRYLGNDDVSVLGLTVTPKVNDAEYCVPVEVNLGDKSWKMSGRKPFDPNDCGKIELSISLASKLHAQQNKGEDLGITFEQVIESFVLQKKSFCQVFQKPSPTQISPTRPNETGSSITYDHSYKGRLDFRKMFNVFEIQRNGEKKSIVSLTKPIEKGQAVELRLLSMHDFDPSWLEEESAGKIRRWIQDRLHNLTIDLLLELVGYVGIEIARPLSRSIESAMMDSAFRCADRKNAVRCSSSTPTCTELIIARRRIHWLTVKIKENVESIGIELPSVELRTDLLWSKEFVDKIREHWEWNVSESEPIWKEIKLEINHEFTNRGFNGFASTKNLWCPMANQLYDDTVNLFAGLSAKFGGLTEESDPTNALRSLISTCISKLHGLSIVESQEKKEIDLTELALTYKDGCCHNSNVLPSLEQIVQPYTDAMELCDEQVSIKEVQIVATTESCRSNERQITRFEDLKKTKIREVGNIDVRWYVNTQILAVVHCAVRSALYTICVGNAKNYLQSIESQMIEAAKIASGEANVEIPTVEAVEVEKQPSNSVVQNVLSPTPSSTPFFFGFVWPYLRNGGWKLVIGNSASDISYVPPAPTKTSHRNHNFKVSLTRQRSHCARETNSFGLGHIPKLTKRLLIQSLERTNGVLPQRENDPTPSTKAVLESFSSSVRLSIEKADASPNNNGHQKIEQIVTQIMSLFDKLIHLTFGEEDHCKLEEGKQWSNVLDCTHLFRFLLALPTFLQEANLSFREYQQTIIVVRELVKFISENYQELFPSFIKLPNEEYHSDHSFPSRLLSQMMDTERMNIDLGLGKSLKYSVSDDRSREVIRPKDRSELTDFVAIVMSQTVLDKATPEDKNRAGQPCIVCRHCLGVNGGKYFYGSYESLATATTVVEKHILKCAKVTDEVKQEVTSARTYHSKQRKNLPMGAQGAFFVRLYSRMQSMIQPCHEPEISSDDSTMSTLQTKEKISATRADTRSMAKKEVGVEVKINDCREFKNHLEVMGFIQSTEPWRSNKPLGEMISKYYNCLDYGGKIFHTDQSPLVFSSEWLYSKLVS